MEESLKEQSKRPWEKKWQKRVIEKTRRGVTKQNQNKCRKENIQMMEIFTKQDKENVGLRKIRKLKE